MICIDLPRKIVKMPNTFAAYAFLRDMWRHNNANLMRYEFPVVDSRLHLYASYIAQGDWTLEILE